MTERATDPDLPPAEQATAADLAAILLDSLSELAKAGNVEVACRFAGRACVRLRHLDPRLARRFDAFLHRQSRHLQW